MTIEKSRAKMPISPQEIDRRQEAVKWADSHNRIEGLFSSPEADEIFQSFVRGEIEYDEIRPKINAIRYPG